MALTTCPDCKNQMSTDAAACPRCGRAVPTRWWVKLVRIVALTAIGLAILYFVAR